LIAGLAGTYPVNLAEIGHEYLAVTYLPRLSRLDNRLNGSIDEIVS
jgi:hypothetical protein